ncbi:acyltransferase family protein [Xanthomonas hortorum]|uniref:Acyltransferase 3 domain-containing protein n=1 Tax=Xanthomonas hortorum pv. gardneri TaxID=2754056 RepID=A0A6V7B9T2_9XANT|nr:acyltransferase [Xanthomonas hortorum]MCC4623762.1 acyltransferase [Xanthomonas campestris pv. nigromaculans]APP78703.1 hypothetical protein BJD10_02395 [Xanthomonas hortorum pv. gardneri]EGD17446.1 putative membrane protein [Xanthomonas hortorum ATCC 19865]KLA98593.1 membrane protein [Xanthomonas hortorum pv. gardneri]KLB01718.1 membrane protein [Xanthomonas hortorum pv. gardneri]
MTYQTITGNQKRDDWVDWLRGASVLMVIVLHAYGFAFDAYPELRSGAAGESSTLMLSIERINRSLAPLRMQLMFLLSGLFVARGLDKGIATYFSGKLRHVLYPYLIWSLLIFALREAGSVLAKAEPIAWLDLGRIAVGNVALTWFLFYLFVFLAVIPLLRRLPAPLVLATTLLGSVCLGPLLRQGADPFYYFAFFYIGTLLAGRVPALLQQAPRWIWSLSCLSLCAIVLIANLTALHGIWIGYLPLVVIALPLVIAAAIWANQQPAAQAIRYVGRNSVVFYLTHFPPFIVLAYLLPRWIHDGSLLFFALLGTGVLAPTLLCLLRTPGRLPALNLLFSAPMLARTTRPTTPLVSPYPAQDGRVAAAQGA